MNRLELNTEIYSVENILQTCEVYKNLAEIRARKKKGKIILIFEKCRYECSITMKEFENYLINIENI